MSDACELWRQGLAALCVLKEPLDTQDVDCGKIWVEDSQEYCSRRKRARLQTWSTTDRGRGWENDNSVGKSLALERLMKCLRRQADSSTTIDQWRESCEKPPSRARQGAKKK